MLTTESKPDRQNGKRLQASERLAIAAALGSGMSQLDVAKAFNVSRSTVQIIKAEGLRVENKANVLADNWRERHALKAVTLDQDVDEIKDAAKRHAAKLAMLKGLGLYGNDNQVTVKLEQWLGSAVVQRITAEFKTGGPEHSVRPEQASISDTNTSTL